MRSMKLTILALAATVGIGASALAQSGQTRDVSNFHGIATGGSFDVHVKIDGTESLRIDAAPEDLKKIETKVVDGILKIEVDEEYRNHNRDNNHFGRVDVYVTAKSLSSLSLGGSGSIDVEGVVKGDNVHVSVGGSGAISTAVEGGSLHTSIAGSGNVKLKGKAGNADITISGSGNLTGDDLKTDEANISIAGSGNCHLGVEKTISAYVAGSGSVYYSGNATVASFSTAGSGRIHKM